MVLRFALLSEIALVEAGGCPSIVRIFEQVSRPAFPAQLHSCVVSLGVLFDEWEIGTDANIAVQVIAPDDTELAYKVWGVLVQLSATEQMQFLVYDFDGLPLTQPGNYRFHVHAAGLEHDIPMQAFLVMR